MALQKTIVFGDIVNPKNDKTVEYLKDYALFIDEHGKIEKKIPAFQITEEEKKKYVTLNFSDHLILPGLIDCHTHLPQYPIKGLGEGTLLEWLNTYVFPYERKFADHIYAKHVSQLYFNDLVKNGTTTACVFSSCHTDATDVAFSVAENVGLRAFIGKVLMEEGFAPQGLSESLPAAIKGSEFLIEKWNGADDGRLKFIVTPRFALMSSKAGLKACADLAYKHSLFVQTHCSENLEEVRQVKERYKENKNYVDVYLSAGLVSEKTLLAHCIHLSSEEEEMILNSGASLVHCPCSNSFLKSGLFKFRELKNTGQKIVMGTDVGAGWSHSLLHEMRHCIETSKMRSFLENEPNLIVTTEEAFFATTLNAAKTLHMEDKIGSLEKSKEADFIVLNNDNLDQDLPVKERFIKAIYSQDLVVKGTYVRGKNLYLQEM